MACRLILVDDEPNILYGLRDSIPWSAMGYEIVGTFSDGMEALAYIENNPVDVVVTDIKMKRLSGIELAECLYKRWPQIIIVFFSAYNEFEYACKALRYNVAGYMLKSADMDEVQNFMQDVLYGFLARGNELVQDSVKCDGDLRRWEIMIETLFTDPDVSYFSDIINNAKFPFDVLKSYVTVFSIEAEDGYLKWKYGMDGFFYAVRDFFFYNMDKTTIFICRAHIPITIIMLHTEAKTKSFWDNMCFEINDLFGIKVAFKDMVSYNGLKEALNCAFDDDSTDLDKIVSIVKKFLSENPGAKILVEDVACELNYSASHLSRVFKEKTGKSLNHYLNEAKLIYAKELLRQGMYVYEVCEYLGYKSVQYFSKLFKEYSGLTPVEYRVRNLRKGGRK